MAWKRADPSSIGGRGADGARDRAGDRIGEEAARVHGERGQDAARACARRLAAGG